MNAIEPQPLWLDYMSNQATDMIIRVGEGPYIARKNSADDPILSMMEEAVNAPMFYDPEIVKISGPVVTKGEFFHEISRFIKTAEQWHLFFIGKGMNYSYEAEDKRRYRLHINRGHTETPHIVIYRIPSALEMK